MKFFNFLNHGWENRQFEQKQTPTQRRQSCRVLFQCLAALMLACVLTGCGKPKAILCGGERYKESLSQYYEVTCVAENDYKIENVGSAKVVIFDATSNATADAKAVSKKGKWGIVVTKSAITFHYTVGNNGTLPLKGSVAEAFVVEATGIIHEIEITRTLSPPRPVEVLPEDFLASVVKIYIDKKGHSDGTESEHLLNK